ncbi:MAG: methyltransferase domain-containing protein [Candidatus Margulisiibacteriota bacterium]
MLNKTRVCKSFSRRAGLYDQTSQLQQGIARELARQINIEDPRCILDIGCGTGFLTKLLSAKYPEASIKAVDLSPGMIEQARLKHPSIEFQVGDAEALPYPDQAFDCIVSSTTYQWLTDLKKAFLESGRVLKGDGEFIFSMFGGRTLTELRESYRQAFTAIHPYQTVPLHPFINYCDLLNILSDYQIVSSKKEIILTSVPNLKTLLRQIKNWGAQSAHNDRLPGLGNRRLLELTEQYYKEHYSIKTNDTKSKIQNPKSKESALHGSKTPELITDNCQLTTNKLKVTWEIFYVKVRKKI